VANHRDRRNLDAPRRHKQGSAGVGGIARDVAQADRIGGGGDRNEIDERAIVSGGGTLIVGTGGTDSGAAIRKGGTEGRFAATLALLGNYMAGSFVAAGDGHGGALVTQAQPLQLPLLARPQA
jgi:hypothetical protein